MNIFVCINTFWAQSNALPKFRAVWITTVKRLDYPSRKYLNSEQLKQEYLDIIDSCQAIGANAIIFQVRPAADAFYNSPYEPWSEWLTGRQGVAPKPFFDPLEFMIEQVHKRGMEFHAWINPYRAIATIGKANIAKNHITRTKPEWFFDYGVNRYFNPGIPDARKHIVTVIADITRRYDVDAIHFDDYFYPYPLRNEARKIIPIPDYSTYKKYGNNFDNIKDWRRNNVNLLIKEVHDSIKIIKPSVKFGVSPPGVWRNKTQDPQGSSSMGLAAYDWLFADVLFWLENDWLDYVAPQLYWYIEHPRADFRILLNWWSKHNFNADLYVGLNIAGIDPTGRKKHWGNPNEIPNQIKLASAKPAVKGFILYRYENLKKNPLGIKDSLRTHYFNEKNIEEQIFVETDTLIYNNEIANTEPDTIAPDAPKNVEKFRIGREITIVWDDAQKYLHDTSNSYNVYAYAGRDKKQKHKLVAKDKYKTVFNNSVSFERQHKWQLFGRNYTFVITAVDKAGNESRPSRPIFIRL